MKVNNYYQMELHKVIAHGGRERLLTVTWPSNLTVPTRGPTFDLPDSIKDASIGEIGDTLNEFVQQNTG